MSVKAILILCAQALLVKSAFGQPCTSRAAVSDASAFGGALGLAGPFGYAASAGLPCNGLANYNGLGYNGLGYNGLGAGFAGLGGLGYDGIYGPGPIEYTATGGGGLPVSSASAIAPVGISVASENVYEGGLTVVGELPFVGTAALEGVVPSAGAGAVNHACGNGRNSMSSGSAAYAPAAAAYAPGAYGFGAGYGLAGAISPAAAALATPGLGYNAGLAGRGCGCL